MLYHLPVGTHGGNGADGTINTEGKGGKVGGKGKLCNEGGIDKARIY